MKKEKNESYLDWSNRGETAIWRYLLAIVLAIVAIMVGGRAINFVAGPFLGDPGFTALPPGPIIRQALTVFLPGVISFPFIVKYVLKRPAWSFALPAWPPRWQAYFFALLLGWIATGLSYLFMLPVYPLTYRGFGGFDAIFLALLFPTMLAFAIQTGAEEFLFRGLAMQFVRSLTGFLPVVLMMQAIAFGALHIPNIAELGGGPLAMTPYLVTAMMLGWIAWRTGSLLVPMGLHLANNTFLFLFIGVEVDVLNSAAPWVLAVTPTLWSSTLFSLIQAALQIGTVELLVRKGVFGGIPPTVGDDQS